jgi:hypothetical protein
MRRLRWIAVMVGAVLLYPMIGAPMADATTPAAPATATTTFCKDTAELQGWTAQNFEPGIDQYTTHPNSAYVTSLAQYLQKLSQEAPVAEQADLKVWAGFTQKVADGVGQAELASGVSAGTVAPGTDPPRSAASATAPALSPADRVRDAARSITTPRLPTRHMAPPAGGATHAAGPANYAVTPVTAAGCANRRP